jgi:tetratricopeptide (TPR) repeat protein
MEQGEKAYLSTGEVLKSIAVFLSRNQVEDAAALYSRCQEDIGYQLMSRLPADKKLRQNLAKMFFTAKDFQKAGNICEELGEYHKAGQLYEKSDDYLLAAEMYARVENHQKAAEMFERYATTTVRQNSTPKSKTLKKRHNALKRQSITSSLANTTIT